MPFALFNDKQRRVTLDILILRACNVKIDTLCLRSSGALKSLELKMITAIKQILQIKLKKEVSVS